jgi:AbrB family looped-hinge helix DNA binding protein
MKITSKGQVTIPVAIREKAGLLPQSEVEFVLSANRVWLRKIRGRGLRGARLIQAMRGRGAVRMTTDQIMALTRGE